MNDAKYDTDSVTFAKVNRYGAFLVINGKTMPQCPRCGRTPIVKEIAERHKGKVRARFKVYCEGCEFSKKSKFGTLEVAMSNYIESIGNLESKKKRQKPVPEGVLYSVYQNAPTAEKRLNNFNDGRLMR